MSTVLICDPGDALLASASFFRAAGRADVVSSGGTGAATTFGAGISATPGPHQHYRQRHHYHSSHLHTVSPDALFGHFTGYARDRISRHILPASLSQGCMGRSAAPLCYTTVFTWDPFNPILYSDGTFRLQGGGITFRCFPRGKVSTNGAGDRQLTGTFLIVSAGTDFPGLFRLTKIG